MKVIGVNFFETQCTMVVSLRYYNWYLFMNKLRVGHVVQYRCK